MTDSALSIEEQPSTPPPRTFADDLRDRFPAALLQTSEFRGEPTAVVVLDSLLDVLTFLKQAGYDYLEDVTAVDWPERDDARFDVVYQLLSLQQRSYFRIKVLVAEDEPVPTVTPIWPGANWFEREIADLFGIEFTDHPDPRRIFMPDGWIGHPLRKDYPIMGFERGTGAGANPPVVHQYGSRPDMGPGGNNNAGWAPLVIAPAAATRAKEINVDQPDPDDAEELAASRSGQRD